MERHRVYLSLDSPGGRKDDVVFQDGGATRLLRESGRAYKKKEKYTSNGQER